MSLGTAIFRDWFLERPIVVAPLTGLIMGNFHTGLVGGGMLELVFMGKRHR